MRCLVIFICGLLFLSGSGHAAEGPGKPHANMPKELYLEALLLAAGVTEPVFFDPRARWKLPGASHGWTTDHVMGLMFAFDLGDQTPREALASTLGGLAGKCSSKKTSKIEPSQTVGKFTFIDGGVDCPDDGTSTAAFATAMIEPDGATLFVHMTDHDHAATAERWTKRVRKILQALAPSR